jgi:hypothetical protein
MKLADEKKRRGFFFWGMGEAKFRFCLLGSMECVWILIIVS